MILAFITFLSSDVAPFHQSLDSFRLHDTANDDVFERCGHTLISSGKSFYIVGGYSKLKQRDCVIAKIDFDTSWTVAKKTIFPSEQSMFCASAATAKSAYIFGGRASPKQPSAKLFKIDLSSGDVVDLDNVSGQKPSARWKHSLTAVSESELVLIGGRDSSRVFADIYLINVDSNKWKFLHRLGHGLHSHSAVVYDGKLVIIGGLDGRGDVIKKFYFYDWTKKKR